MSVDTGLEIAGIVIAVVLGVGGFLISKTVRSRNTKQSQKVGRSGVGIQSGRDTNLK